MTTTLGDITSRLDAVFPTPLTGSVVATDGVSIHAADFPAPVGSLCEVDLPGADALRGEVIGLRDRVAIISPLGDVSGVRRGSRVRLAASSRTIGVGPSLLGRVIDAHGRPLDGQPAPSTKSHRPLRSTGINSHHRPPIDRPLATGVRAIDGLLTCGRGQRMGIFAASGVGKSTLLGMLTRGTDADVIVAALVGERGREVNEFLHDNLNAEARARSLVVVSTSDEPALSRVQAALAATAVAEHFRDEGANVLLIVDSLSRFAVAQREIACAAGESPSVRGYPPSVLSALARLVERAGGTTKGSITAFYSVLVDGDDLNEPLSDAARSLLDGHVVLSRRLAERGHWPAIDPLASVSRLAPSLMSAPHAAAASRLRAWLAARRDREDLIAIGAYRPGSERLVDEAIAREEAIQRFLTQPAHQLASWEETRSALMQLAETPKSAP